MEAILRVTHEGDKAKIETTFNPGDFPLPTFGEKEGAYYIHYPGEEITSALAQANSFDLLVLSQLEYENNGVVVRFVSLNSEVKATDFTLRLILKKATKTLARPSPLREVLSDSLMSVGKNRP